MRKEIATVINNIKKKKMRKRNGKPTAARRIRTKTRKPKFLSLISLELMSSEKGQETTEMPPADDDVRKCQQQQQQQQQQQLQYLFPLHPENLVEDNYYYYNNNKDSCQHDENMAYLFSAAADGGDAASTLTGLLGSSAETTTATTSSCSYNSGEEDDYYYYKSQMALVRTALKNKERDSSEERYVRYSEVVDRRRDEEVSSTTAAGAAVVDEDFDDLRCGSNRIGNQKRLSLKLDYEEILNAWSDKGPLYVYGESPRTVPDVIHPQFLPHEFPIITNGTASDDGWRNDGCSWRVPELTRNIGKVHEIKEQKHEEAVVVVGVGAEEEWKVGQREASVLRYKEKRQNRLFSKRIRYQVRKLNAEKRPRVKGRFVKRS